MDETPAYDSRRETAGIQLQATFYFIVSIAAIGAVMMTLTSSPTAKGASFLWLPAALQLMAGVWLGPGRGMIAGGVGAYLAGIIAYGGWGGVDIVMNLVAGGIANSALPAILFRIFRVDPTFGTGRSEDPRDMLKAAVTLITLLGVLLIATFIVMRFSIGLWGHVPTLVLVLLAPTFLRGLNVNKRHFITAFCICVLVSAVSALIGAFGQTIGGQTWRAALIGTGIGWFLGDTVSSVLGLYILAAFTPRARDAGIAGGTNRS